MAAPIPNFGNMLPAQAEVPDVVIRRPIGRQNFVRPNFANIDRIKAERLTYPLLNRYILRPSIYNSADWENELEVVFWEPNKAVVTNLLLYRVNAINTSWRFMLDRGIDGNGNKLMVYNMQYPQAGPTPRDAISANLPNLRPYMLSYAEEADDLLRDRPIGNYMFVPPPESPLTPNILIFVVRAPNRIGHYTIRRFDPDEDGVAPKWRFDDEAMRRRGEGDTPDELVRNVFVFIRGVQLISIDPMRLPGQPQAVEAVVQRPPAVEGLVARLQRADADQNIQIQELRHQLAQAQAPQPNLANFHGIGASVPIPIIAREAAAALMPPPRCLQPSRPDALIATTGIPWMEYALATQLKNTDETDIHRVFRNSLVNPKRLMEILAMFPLRGNMIPRWKVCMYHLTYYFALQPEPIFNEADAEIMSPQRVYGMVEWLANQRLANVIGSVSQIQIDRFDQTVSLLEAVPAGMKADVAFRICNNIFTSYQKEDDRGRPVDKILTLMNWEPSDDSACGTGSLDYMLIQCGNAFQDAFGLGYVNVNTNIFDTKDWVLRRLFEDEEEPVDGDTWQDVQGEEGYVYLSKVEKLEKVRAFLQSRRGQTPLTEKELNDFIDSEFASNGGGIFLHSLGKKNRSMRRKRNRSNGKRKRSNGKRKHSNGKAKRNSRR